MSIVRGFATVAFIVAALSLSQSSNAKTGAAEAALAGASADMGASTPFATAQPQAAAGQDCEKIKQDIQQLQDEIAKISAEMQTLTNELNQLNTQITQDQKDVSGFRARGYLSEATIGELLDALANLMRVRNQLEQALEDDAKEIQAIKDTIADLLNKLASCGPPSTTRAPTEQTAGPPQSGGAPSSPQTPAGEPTTPLQPPGQQVAGQDCEKIKQDIQQLQDEIAMISAEMQTLTNELNQLNTQITQDQKDVSGFRARGYLSEATIGELLDALANLMRVRNQLEQALEDDAKEIQAIKDTIADLLNKLASCGPPSATQPPNPPSPPQENKKVAFDFRGFGGATFVNGNAPSTAGFDGAVLFPLGNRVLVGPTAGFEWVSTSIINSFGSMTAGSTFGNDGIGFKEGNFGGQLGLNLSGWELGIRGGATVAGSTITQNEGFCNPTAGCTISSTTTTHDRITSPFLGGYISHSVFSHVGVFAEFDYRHQKDDNVLNVSDRAVVGGVVLSFGRHKVK